MDFDWNSPPFEWNSSLSAREVEESFEDPFLIRLLPDSDRFSAQARYFNLGRSAAGLGIISIYRTNGKQIRVLYARSFLPEEEFFYERRAKQMLAQ